MSTTVTYKGETLTTVNNQTRTLETAGKYLEDNLTLTDVSSSAVSFSVERTTQDILATSSQRLVLPNITSQPSTVVVVSKNISNCSEDEVLLIVAMKQANGAYAGYFIRWQDSTKTSIRAGYITNSVINCGYNAGNQEFFIYFIHTVVFSTTVPYFQYVVQYYS